MSDVTSGDVRSPTGTCTAVFDPLNEDRTLLRCDGLYLIQSSEPPAEPRELRSVPRQRLVALISPEDFGRPNAPFQLFLPDSEGTRAIDDEATRLSIERRVQSEVDRRVPPNVQPFVTAGSVSLAGAQVTELYESTRVRYDSVNPTARSVAVLAQDASGRTIFRRILRPDPDPILRRIWRTPNNAFTRGLTALLGPDDLASGEDVVMSNQVCRPQARLYVFGSTIFSPLQGFGEISQQRQAARAVDRETYVLLQFIEVLDVTLALLSDIASGAFDAGCVADAVTSFILERLADVSAQIASGTLEQESFKQQLYDLARDTLVGCTVGNVTSAIAQRTCNAVAAGASAGATPAAGLLVRAVCALGPTIARTATRAISSTRNAAFAQQDLPIEAQTCSGACTSYCTPGTMRCGLTSFEECDASGCGWRSRERCSCGCSASGCEDAVCTASDLRCSPDGRRVEVCHASGCRWDSRQTCACGCEGGRCTGQVCVPGTRECDDRAVRECLPTGCGWRTLTGCPAGSRCVDNQCRGCGGLGEPCCAGESSCGVGLVCNARSTCERCTPTCAGRCGGMSNGCGGRCDEPCAASRTVRVLAPNGGESLQVGTPFTVRWASTGEVRSVRVELIESGTPVELLAATQPNGSSGGSLEFIPLPRHGGRSFSIRVSANEDRTVSDAGDRTFSVAAPPPCAGDPMIGAPCSDGVGACRRTGTFACASGVRRCSATAGPRATEVCGNDVDEDCDGADATCPRPCAGDSRVGNPCSSGTGACVRSGVWECRGGMTVCGAMPGTAGTEYCNNIDDDCDGETDEEVFDPCYSGPSATLGVGLCRAGRTQCRSGMFGACIGDVRPSSEVCGNGMDENCDGRDETCATPCSGDPRLGTSCSIGAGSCLRTGTWVCVSGSVACNAVPPTTSPESCTNRLDDDCDGVVDCGDPDCARDPACRICMYNGCFDRGLSSGAWCDDRTRVACTTVDGCAVEGTRTDCTTFYPHASGAGCFSGNCLLPSNGCDAGYGNCDSNDVNGCETDLRTSVANCGTCGRVCTSPTGTPVCQAGACGVTGCPSGTTDCDGNASNGCEVNTNSDNYNCGGCGVICGPGAGCVGGTCRCPTGQTYCSAGCFDVQTSASNCGACGNVCPVGTRCFGGSCSALCPGTQVDCSGACADFQTDVRHCGRCHNQCPWNAHATPTCAAAVCGQSCDSGFGDCDGTATNGCELDLRSDASNCGTCGRRCGVGISCSVGTCGTDPIAQVSGSMTHTCALRESGRVLCFGSGGGALGNGGVFYSLTPVAVVGLTDAIQIDVGQYTSCAVRAGGSVMCWGSNGMNGDGTTTARLVPTPVVGITDAVQVSVGYSSACARRSGGSVICWGVGSGGLLGNGATVSSLTPVPVTGLTDAVQIAVGRSNVCARRAGGGVVCWGSGANGALGDGSTVLYATTPVAVSGLNDAVQIALVSASACAIRATGAVVCWGENTAGQLGDGTTRDALTPVTVLLGSISDVTGVACGEDFTCVSTVTPPRGAS